MLRTARQRQIIRPGVLQHPVRGGEFLVRSITNGLFYIALPGLSRKSTRDGITSGKDLVPLPQQACNCHARVACGSPGFEFRIDPVTRWQPLHHCAQYPTAVIDQRDLGVRYWPLRRIRLANIEAHQPLGTARHVFPVHTAAIVFQPKAPKTRELVTQVCGLHAFDRAQHQVRFQGVVGILDIARRWGLINANVSCADGRCRFRRL